MPGDHPRIDLPDQDDEPLVWDARSRAFVAARRPAAAPSRPSSRPKKQWFVGSDDVGRALPPRDGGQGAAPAPAPTAPRTVAAPVRPAPAPPPRPQQPLPDPRPQARSAPRPQPAPAEAPPPPKAPRRRRRRRLLRRPKLRWIALFLALLPLLLVALLIGGWFYANSKFNQHRAGRGLLGALARRRRRHQLPHRGLRLPGRGGRAGRHRPQRAAQRGGTGGPAVRHDADPAHDARGRRTMSIPRDLFVTLPDGDEGRINGAFNDGPAALDRDHPVQPRHPDPPLRRGRLRHLRGAWSTPSAASPSAAEIVPVPGVRRPRRGSTSPRPARSPSTAPRRWPSSAAATTREDCGRRRADRSHRRPRPHPAPAGLPAHGARRRRRQPQPAHPHAHRRLGHRGPAHRRRDDHAGRRCASRGTWASSTPCPSSSPPFGVPHLGGAAVLGLVEDAGPRRSSTSSAERQR